MVDTGSHRSSLDMRSLAVFLAVADTRSMTRAAQRLGTTQSAVSQAMRRLEGDLNATLIDRANRPLRLTAAGRALAREADAYLDAADALTESVRLAAETEKPAARLGLIDSFAATAGPGLIRRLRRHVEQITVWSGIAPNLWSEMLERRLDAMIATEIIKQRGISQRELLTEPFVIILPNRWVTGEKQPRLADLAANQPFVRYSLRSHIGRQIEDILQRAGAQAPHSLEFDGTDAALPMVAAGLGWAITTPLCLVHGRAYVPNLAILPIGEFSATRTLYVLAQNSASELQQMVADQSAAILSELIGGPARAVAPWAAEGMVIHA